MKKAFDIIPYSEQEGCKFEWEDNFCIEIESDNRNVIIRANSEGLVSLARIFLTLAQTDVPMHTHIHLDDINSLEENSSELIIEKTLNV